jgi:hypothetical protein
VFPFGQVRENLVPSRCVVPFLLRQRQTGADAGTPSGVSTRRLPPSPLVRLRIDVGPTLVLMRELSCEVGIPRPSPRTSTHTTLASSIMMKMVQEFAPE